MADKIKLKFIELKREPSACGHVGSHVALLQSLERECELLLLGA